MTVSFKELGISESRAEYLESIGFVEPTEIQVKAIPYLLDNRDMVGQAQTGTGKTATFALPILETIDLDIREPQALILTPTRELAEQVRKAIRDLTGDKRIRVTAIYGGQSIDRQIQRLRNGVHIAVGTPGRVIDLLERRELTLDDLSWVVLDEADEMLNMGFIQDVEKILSQVPTERQTACFSATMPPSIRSLVDRFLRSPVTVTVERTKAAPVHINQIAYMIPRGWTKQRALQPILEMESPESAIIFVRTRRQAAELTSQLQTAGYSVDEYHGDLSQSQRERLMARFRHRQVRWVVATDIAARGLHVDDLSHVINYDLPDNLENYVHRIGRTGRAGKEGTAICLVQGFERRKLNQIERYIRQKLTISKIPTRAQIEARHIDRLQGQVEEAVTGERMASFLPLVAKLSEAGYEPHAIAAAALQMAYDTSRPAWTQTDYDATEEDVKYSTPKPKLTKRSKGSPVLRDNRSRGNRERRDRHVATRDNG
ncbi:DEAD/DEAH box helicase [Roseofilum casamattae]|uniref:RNA helicase n=1 Tax=Roseofilum casamattae BLCC-M143 TaxID=3022442 RepID=A0ABT7C2E7_9CYAN|nr:DEAD/DEAH box helicase [Roseofilum casamattae]MDJ1184851.1 DEAD/DEAH box helicase [Roseofilum casamattae BLCC-M143]